MFTAQSLQIGDLTSKQMALISENLLNINVSYTMDLAGQLTFSVVDPGLEMASNRYFIVGRDVVYETTAIRPVELVTVEPETFPAISRIRHVYEISSVKVSQGEAGASPVYSIEALPKAIQQMKRDKKSGNIGGSGFEFVKRAAKKYGLKFVGEKSTRIKAGSKNSGTSQQDSVWDRITSIAQESQYVVFVTDGTLYFGSQKWFMFRWGSTRQLGKPKLDKNKKPILDKNGVPQRNPSKFFIPIEYPGTIESRKRFEALSMPELSKRENDPMYGEGSAIIARDNGVLLRPGMTVRINNIPFMEKYYLITDVSFSEQTTEPVSIQFRTPERLEVNGKPAEIKPLPIGKKFSSEYFRTKPTLMGTATVGGVNSTPTERIPIGTTPAPSGEEIKARIPNSRRQTYHPIEQKDIKLIVPNSAVPAVYTISSNDFVEAGNIDMWNRPLFGNELGQNNNQKCRTLSMEIHSTTVDINGISTPVYVILEKLFCTDGSVVELSSEDAIDFYEEEHKHHGIIFQSSGIAKAEAYMYVLVKHQFITVKKRFPNNGLEIWSTGAGLPERSRCFA
jgi:hypothetical protein